MEFYGALFGWEFDVGPARPRTTQPVGPWDCGGGLAENPDPGATRFWWNVYLATAAATPAVAVGRAAGGRGGQ